MSVVCIAGSVVCRQSRTTVDFDCLRIGKMEKRIRVRRRTLSAEMMLIPCLMAWSYCTMRGLLLMGRGRQTILRKTWSTTGRHGAWLPSFGNDSYERLALQLLLALLLWAVVLAVQLLRLQMVYQEFVYAKSADTTAVTPAAERFTIPNRFQSRP